MEREGTFASALSSTTRPSRLKKSLNADQQWSRPSPRWPHRTRPPMIARSCGSRTSNRTARGCSASERTRPYDDRVHTPADAADDETAAAGEGEANANPWGRSNASARRADAAEDDDAASDEDIFGGRSADQDVEEVKDPRGIISSSAERYNAALLQRAGSPTYDTTRAEPGWAERPPPDGIARVAGAIILCQQQHVDNPDLDASPPQDDPDWADQATLEMMAEFEEQEKFIARPDSLSKCPRRKPAQKEAKSRSTNLRRPLRERDDDQPL